MKEEKKCENCKFYGILNKSLGERCIVRSEKIFPSGYKIKGECVRAYQIPKERTCKNWKELKKKLEGKK